jgi:hypothetical protein
MTDSAYTTAGFHNASSYTIHKTWDSVATTRQDEQFVYRFENFFHPFVAELIGRLNRTSVSGLFDPAFVGTLSRDVFTWFYTPLNSELVKVETHPETIDLDDGGPYANYNWELFFHVPLTIAVHLSKNQRFAEAQRWFHLIFDPTCTDTTVPAPGRFWKFSAFRKNGPVVRIEELLTLLAKPKDECTAAELARKAAILEGYEAIRRDPFLPHRVARTRALAYQYSVVMKYLDNLIAWGDTLFMQDTIESVNEATQRYVLAANLLGPRPVQLPPRGSIRPQSFAQLKKAGLDAMGNALVELEGQFPFNLAVPGTGSGSAPKAAPLFGVGRSLYFCIPRNDKLLGYWDTVADRLFKVRHCMNIQGVVRQLDLFGPPLDPGMMVKASAAGIDVGSIVSGLNQPIGPVRALPMIQKALELCAEVRALGNALLAATEKRDGERITLLRQRHETAIQKMSQDVRFLQLKHAEEATEALLRGRRTTLERYRHFLRLLGVQPDAQLAPETLTPDRRELTEENFDETFASLVTQFDRVMPRQPDPAVSRSGASAPAAQSGAQGLGQMHLSVTESAEVNTHLPQARDTRRDSAFAEIIATVLTFIPEFDAKLAFWGLGAGSKIFGGSKMSDAIKIGAQVARTNAALESDNAGITNRTSAHERRAEEWALQSNVTALELQQVGRQLIASLIAEQIARHDYDVTKRQIANSEDIERFLFEDKQANEDLYTWMQGEVARLYYEYYRFAADTARRAERTMKRELMRPEVDATDYIRFNYWDRGRDGLLSADALHLDLKRMEMAYHDYNRREYELTRHISLRQLDPFALLQLTVTGSCEISIPESFYDRDCPGHYLRRLRTVAVSIPAVAGPYASVNCTLSLLRSSIRTSPALRDGAYARTGPDDDRFVDYYGLAESVVTSGPLNDGGLFEPSARDERLLPFEGAGAVGTWRLELPREFRPFNYATISDLILHVRYTARQGGEQLGDAATAELRTMLETANTSGLALLLSLPHDFASEWSSFAAGDDLTIRVRRDRFPYMVQTETLTIDALDLYASDGTQLVRRPVTVPATMSDELNDDDTSDLTLPPDATVLTRTAKEVYLIVRYSI